MDITHVEIVRDQVVRLRFADGTVKMVDLGPYLSGPVFAAIRDDPGVFASVRVDHDAGTIVWSNGADLAPDVLYDDRSSVPMESGTPGESLTVESLSAEVEGARQDTGFTARAERLLERYRELFNRLAR